MEGFVTDWLNLAIRWFHVIAAIAWIGESFYFVALDNSLKPPTDPNQRRRGVFGGIELRDALEVERLLPGRRMAGRGTPN